MSISPGEKVLVTGGTGSLGSALVPALLAAGARIVVMSRDEKKGLDLRRQYPEVEHRLGDVRDARAVFLAMLGMDTVIHCSALKYLDVSERQPTEYALTNVLGTINVLDAAQRSGTVRRVVGISSDKVSRAVNAYGLTKALLEKLFIEAHLNERQRHPRRVTDILETGREAGRSFVVARYGNVVASRGSVIPFWAEQRRQGKPLSVTDPTMTRFFFTLDDAVRLVDVALAAPSGTIVAQPMPACTLGQLAEVMTDGHVPFGAKAFDIVGRRPGEKIHEELLTAEEMEKVEGRSGNFFYHPLGMPPHAESKVYQWPSGYTSDRAPRLTDDELRAMIKEWIA